MSAFAFGAGVLIGEVGVGFGRFAFARLATASLTLFWPPQIVISTVRGLAELLLRVYALALVTRTLTDDGPQRP